MTGWGARGFDHPMTQHLFYRNCIDPYSWHWRNGHTKWNVADVFRAAFALEPDGARVRRSDLLPHTAVVDRVEHG